MRSCGEWRFSPETRISMKKHIDDILIIAGESLIVAATAMINPLVAMYVAGAFLILDGVLVGVGQHKAVSDDHQ